MQELFNDYVQNLETYIMFRIKEKVAQLTPELKAKGRAPISLAILFLPARIASAST